MVQSRPLSFGLSHSLSLFGPGTQLCSCGPLVRRVLPLCTVYIVTNYLYALALRTLTNTEVSATMAMESLLVYLLSFALLVSETEFLIINYNPAPETLQLRFYDNNLKFSNVESCKEQVMAY